MPAALPSRNLHVAALAKYELERREEERARARKVESSTSDLESQRKIREATRSTAFWMRNHTKTFNPHWVEEGRPAPNEAFPEWYFFEPMVEMIEREKVCAIEKSRDMMVSWGVVAYFTLQAMTVPHREIVFQSIDTGKAEQLIDYAKCLYDQQEAWLRDAFPLTKATEKQARDVLMWENGSVIWSVPSGKNQIRSFHPWGYFNDETSFQPEAGLCLDAALGSGAKKLVMVSTANIGWFADYRKDVTL
jgi:hypothetical protein